jgi:hypothetical protein
MTAKATAANTVIALYAGVGQSFFGSAFEAKGNDSENDTAKLRERLRGEEPV